MNSKITSTLIINLSLSTVKTIIITDKGDKIYENWLPIQTSINGSTIEQDPNEWWAQLKLLLVKIFENKKLQGNIDYITVTSSSSCLVMLDKNGVVIGKSIMVSDKRAEKEAKYIKQKYPNIFENPAMRAEPGYMFPKILWFKKNNKNLFSKVNMFLSSNDFLVYRLTNKYITDELNAEKFYFDNESGKYPAELLKLVGLSQKNFPKILPIGTTIGIVNEEIKKTYFSNRPIKVIISTYDAICALIGSSTHEEGELNNVCGTCSSYRILTKTYDSTKSKLLIQKIREEKQYIIGGSNNLEGGVLEWAKNCFYGDSFLQDNNFLYELIQKEASESELGSKGILFIPYLIGERFPFSDPYVRGMFFGIERFHTRHDMIRSVLEAMAFQARLMVDEFEKNNIPIASVNMSGGGAKLKFSAQLRADVLGLPVNVLAEVETTAMGAFILCLKARKVISSIKKGKKFVKISQRYLPNMHNHNSYSSLFILYKQLYTSNSHIFRLRREMLDKIFHYQKNILENL